MQRFLIIQTAFLGDVILMTPVISELNRIYPDSKIDVVVRKGNESLLAQNSKINKVFIWDKKSKKYSSLYSTIKNIRQYKYDEVITLQRYTNAGLMTYFTKAKNKVGFDRNSLSWIYHIKVPHSLLEGSHEVERNLRTISHHGAEKRIRPELFPSVEDYQKVKPYQQERYFCAAPASVWETKKLPIKKWVELIQQLISMGNVYLLGGPEDKILCDEIIAQTSSLKVQNLCGKLSLLQSAALMKEATMNFVNDSGPLHIASAMNAPTRAFFCSTIPKFGFGPLADDSKVIEVKEKLECRPCTYHGRKKCPLQHYKCGNMLDVSLNNLDL